jgi:FlaA1/EpsC-like NDP-sugar epimerase
VGVVRHSGGKDFTRLFQATVEATLFLLVLSFTTAIEYNRTALVSQAMLFLILSVGGRLAVRSMFLSVQLRKAKKGNIGTTYLCPSL